VLAALARHGGRHCGVHRSSARRGACHNRTENKLFVGGAGRKIKAEGKVLRAGRNFVVTECEIFNAGGGSAAKALLTFGAAGGHSIEHADHVAEK